MLKDVQIRIGNKRNDYGTYINKIQHAVTDMPVSYLN